MFMRALPSILLLAMTGCMLPPNVAILIPDEGGTIGKASISNAGGTVPLDKPYSTVGASAKSVDKPFFANFAQVEYEFGSVLKATPRPPVKYTLYFLNGAATLDPESASVLEGLIVKAKATPNADLSVVGHADATGSEAVNVRVSQARAASIRDNLTAAGIPASIIEVTSHGSGNPRVPTPRGVAEPRNRRVEVTIR